MSEAKLKTASTAKYPSKVAETFINSFSFTRRSEDCFFPSHLLIQKPLSIISRALWKCLWYLIHLNLHNVICEFTMLMCWPIGEKQKEKKRLLWLVFLRAALFELSRDSWIETLWPRYRLFLFHHSPEGISLLRPFFHPSFCRFALFSVGMLGIARRVLGSAESDGKKIVDCIEPRTKPVARLGENSVIERRDVSIISTSKKKIKFRSLGLCWLNARLLLRIIINSDLLIATEKRDDGEYNPMDRMYSSDSRSNSINGDDQSIKFWVLAKKIIFLRLFRQHIIFQKIKIRRVDILQIIHKTSIYCMRGMVNIKCLWISARGFFIAGSSDDSLKVSFNWLTLIAFLKNWM